jgi:hypothetical protein
MMRFLVVLVLGVLLVATAGCGKKTESQAPAGTGMARPIQPVTLDFEKVEEVAPTGDFSVAVHKDVQPVLAAVFGGAKLSAFFEMPMGPGGNGSHFTYALKRQAKANDLSAVKQKLEAEDYKFIAETPRNGIETFCFEKKLGEKTYAVTLGLTPGDQRVSVVVFE